MLCSILAASDPPHPCLAPAPTFTLPQCSPNPAPTPVHCLKASNPDHPLS